MNSMNVTDLNERGEPWPWAPWRWKELVSTPLEMDTITYQSVFADVSAQLSIESQHQNIKPYFEFIYQIYVAAGSLYERNDFGRAKYMVRV